MWYAKPDNWVSRPLAYEDSRITGTQPESVQHKRCLSPKNRFHYGFSKCVTFQNKSLLVYFNGYTPVVHLPWKKGSVAEGQLLLSLFSIKLHFLLRLVIDRWILRCCQSITSAKFRWYAVYRQYLFIKAATLVFCTECSETQIVTSSLVN